MHAKWTNSRDFPGRVDTAEVIVMKWVVDYRNTMGLADVQRGKWLFTVTNAYVCTLTMHVRVFWRFIS